MRLRLHGNGRNPSTPIEYLATNMKKYLHMPDCGALNTLMGAVAANMIQGGPVWLMFVGPAGSGKTEMLNSLLGLPGVQPEQKIGRAHV